MSLTEAFGIDVFFFKCQVNVMAQEVGNECELGNLLGIRCKAEIFPIINQCVYVHLVLGISSQVSGKIVIQVVQQVINVIDLCAYSKVLTYSLKIVGELCMQNGRNRLM